MLIGGIFNEVSRVCAAAKEKEKEKEKANKKANLKGTYIGQI